MSLKEAERLLSAATDEARRAYGGAVGRPVRELTTPALVLDLDAAERNIALMGRRMAELQADLRPHIKVHKSPDLARRQVAAGAIGLSCATVWEAIFLAAAGMDGILIVNTVATPSKLAVVAELARERRVLMAVDDLGAAGRLDEAAAQAGSRVDVLIEVDTGMDRCGVDTEEEAIALARALGPLRSVHLVGLTGYEGHCSLTPEREARHVRQQAAMGFLVGIAERIRADGIELPIVSAAGTATWDWTAAFPGVTESQAGSYVVMDNFHGSMVPEFEKAIAVVTTVISRTTGRLVVDAGNKSLGAPDLATIRGADLAVFRFDEEHGIFDAPGDAFRVGDVVELIPGYTPSTVNWYDAYHVARDGVVVDVWPVVPRGPGHHGLVTA